MKGNAMKKLILIALCVLMMGCAKQYIATPGPGMDGSSFKSDNYTCIQQSRTYGGGGGTGSVGIALIIISQNRAQAQADELYRMCMDSRGWVITEKTE